VLYTDGWTAAGRLPPPGQFCFESLQVACYQPGQHFLQHEVGSNSPKTSQKLERKTSIHCTEAWVGPELGYDSNEPTLKHNPT